MAPSALAGRARFVGSFLLASLVVLLPLGGSRLQAGDFDVVISELHYHPPLDAAGEEKLEFVELQNLGDEPVILAGWVLGGGILYQFPADAIIGSRGFLVVARDAALLEASYGIDGVYGNFEGRLSNGGEAIDLRSSDFELIDRVRYGDEDPWPENADGLGPSLEKTDPVQSGENEASWRSSIPLGGTPGAPNSTSSDRAHRTLIAAGDIWRYRKGTAEPSSPIGAWAARTFNDGSWASGPSGFGYGDDDDATVLDDMEDGYTTVYIRKSFSLSSPDAYESLVLSVVYDDAYVAYLNGTEVARSASAGGTPGTPLPYDARAADSHENTDVSDSIDLVNFRGLLRAGDNVLALQGLNESRASSDLSLIPALVGVEVGDSGLVEPAHDLEINEVFAGSSPGEGFIEIHNEGEEAANLSGFRIVASPVGAGGYVFPAGTTLAAGARTVVSGASLPFELTDAAQWVGLVTSDNRFVDGVETRTRPQGRSWGRYPDGDGDAFVLASPTPGSANTVALEDAVVIDEIRYHPPLGQETEEYVELYNRGGQAVDLTGWSLDKGVNYTFGSATIPAGGRVVVSGDPDAVMARYGIAGVLGPWSGRLSNGAEKVELKDALGNRVDVVRYADDGTWPRSTDASGPDGHGPSVELVNPDTENNHGSVWLASIGAGTPGATNSQRVDDPAPVIRSVAHDPPMPRSTDSVTVTARISDDGSVASVRLLSRLDRLDGSGLFSQVTMLDDGLHGDGAAGDGRYGATLAPRTSGAIVQFYVEATDNAARVRRFPSDAPTRVCLYQVDDSGYPPDLRLYRAVLRAADEAELATRDVDSDVLLDGTFIQGKHIFYNVGIRYRGESSRDYAVKSFRVQLSSDEPFGGITRLNLNAVDNHLAHIAADFFRRAGMAVFETLPVAYTLNSSWQARHGGVYLRVEAVDDDFLARVFPGEDEGNLYRGRDPSGAGEGDLRYLGPDPAEYVDLYEKKTNEEANDYSDIIELTDAFTNTPDEDFESEMVRLLEVNQWLRYFAVETLLNNQDGAIATDTGEDYYIYRRPSDGKWVLIPWDQNENFEDPTAGIFRMGISAVRRLVLHPPFLRLYFYNIMELLDGPFSKDVMARQIAAETGIFAQASLDEIASFVPIRQATVRGLIPDRLTAGVEPRYFVATGDTWRYFKGTREPSGGTTSWTGVSFNDDDWAEGPGGFGYGDGDDRTDLPDMEDNYTTVYIRHAFDLEETASINTLTLSIRYDDGFVVYLNGTEVARTNVTGTVRFDSRANSDHEAGAPRIVDLTARRDLLRTGTNVIAAVGLNSSSGSSDLTLDPELYANPHGSGCGTRLVAAGSSVTLGGTAPVLDATSVMLNGSSAHYDPVTGRWHQEITVSAGSSTFEVVALDELFQEIARTSVDVERSGGPSSVSGNLSTTTWTEAAGPYHVTGDLTVPAGVTLTVEAGTAVYADPGVSIVVRGTLNAGGTAEKPVTFQGVSCDSTWGGIVFLGSSARGALEHLQLSGASSPAADAASYPAAISLADGAQVRIEHGILYGLRGPAIHAAGGSELTMTDSAVDDALEGVRSEASYADIERVSIQNVAGVNLWLDGEFSPQSVIRDCVLGGGPVEALELTGASARVEGNVIRNAFGEGIMIAGPCSPLVSRNVVYACGVGIACEDGSTPVLTHNTISSCNVGLHVYEQGAGAGGSQVVADSLIIWDNARSVLVDSASTLGLTYSDVEGGHPGTGNISLYPLFVDEWGGDFRLRPGSPAAGTGKDGEDMGAYPAVSQPGIFTRGDSNGDGSVDISDALKVLLHLFLGVSVPCLDALDADDSAAIDITDATYLLEFLFRGGPAPPSPFPGAGLDPTAGDPYDCGSQ